MHKYYNDAEQRILCAECGDYWPCDDILTTKERHYVTWLIGTGQLHWALEYEKDLFKKYFAPEYRDGLPLFEFESLGCCKGDGCDV